jgi:hypothetical protein
MPVIGNPSAQGRPAAARRGEGDREVGVILAAILGRGDIAEDHIGGHDQPARAAALNDAAADQHQNVR